MQHGACQSCNRSYELNPQSRFQPTCPRCRRLLHVIDAEEGRCGAPSSTQTAPTPPSVLTDRAPPPAAGRRRPAMGRIQVAGVVGVCLAFPLLVGGVLARRVALAPSLSPRLCVLSKGLSAIQLAPGGSASGEALREARWEWIGAQQAAAREIEASPESRPEDSIWHLTDAHRRFLMALDPGGELHRALAAARRADALARTRVEVCRAAALLARLECDAGHHQAELRYARKLIALEPKRRGSWETLKHAAVCSEDPRLERQADDMLERLPVATASPS